MPHDSDDLTRFDHIWSLLWDKTELTAAEFLEELAEHGVTVTRATVSNYVKRGWLSRERVDVGPDGAGRTGYFQRRMVIPFLFVAMMRCVSEGRVTVEVAEARLESVI